MSRIISRRVINRLRHAYGTLVLISIAVKTPQSVARGGYAEYDSTMRWINGDWKLRVPLARPSIIPTVDGLTLLGQPNV